MTVNVRMARAKDKVAIQEFIRKNWKSNHIFVSNDLFFKYEMCTKNVPNFVLAEMEGNIVGLVGFIFNRDSVIESDLYLVMFRVLKVEGASFLGIKILDFVRGLTRHGVHTVGANQSVLSYYRFCGFETGYLKHYYWMSREPCVGNDFWSNGKITDINSRIESERQKSLIVKILRQDARDVVGNTDINDLHPQSKSKDFFLKRFLYHPIYEYQLFQIPGLSEILVVREARIKNHRIWRVVDFFGSTGKFPALCEELIKRAVSESISLIDLYVSGLGHEEILKSGLSSISDDVVIPNYLEPLVMKNIAISYVTSCSYEPIFFRGDCDQDRPST